MRKVKHQKEGEHHKKYFGGWVLTLIIFVILVVFLIMATYSPETHDDQANDGIYYVPVLFSDKTHDEQEYIRGIEMAADKLNEPLKYPLLSLVMCEVQPYYMTSGKNETEFGNALMNFYNAYDSGMYLSIGPISSSDAEEIAPFAEILHDVILSPGASSTTLRAYPNYMFSLYPSDSYLSAALASSVGSSFSGEGENIVAVVYDSDTYPIGIKKGFEQEIKNYASVKPTYILLDSTNNSIPDGVEELKRVNPSCIVFLPGSYDSAYAFISAAKSAGVSGIWVSTDFCLTDRTAMLFNGSTDGVFVYAPSQTVIDDNFAERYREKYGMDCTIEAAYGYDAMMILGTIIQSGHGGTPEEASAHLKNLRYIGVTGMISFDSTGAQYPKYDVLTVQDGKWMFESWKNILQFETSHGHTKI